MEKKENIWLLYKRKWKDYVNQRKLDSKIKQIFNPVPNIISMDVSLLTKGLTILGADEIIKNNDFDFIIKELSRYIVIDGIAWLDVTVKKDNVYLSPLSISEVSNIEYDEGGNIIQITIKTDIFEKKYYIDSNGKKWLKITTEDSETEIPYVREFIPVIEFTGLFTDTDDNVSRVEGIEDIIDDINEYESIIKSIAKLHGDPAIYGNVRLDIEEIAEKDQEREAGELKYFEVPEGGTLQYLEMTGNVMKYAMEKVIQLKEDVFYDYPELTLAKIIKGSGMTGYAIALKLTGLETIITGYRENFKMSLQKSLEYALILLGKNPDISINFEPIIPPDKDAQLNRIIQAYTSGTISFETAVKHTAKIFEEDPVEELDKLKKANVDIYADQFALEVGGLNENEN